MKNIGLISQPFLLAVFLCATALSSSAQAECPLCDLAEAGNAGGIRSFCEDADGPVAVDGRDGTGRTAVLLAARYENRAALTVLVHGYGDNCPAADPDIPNDNGRTAYMWAAQKGNIDIANFLFRAGDVLAGLRDDRGYNDDGYQVDVNRVKDDGRTAADIAVDAFIASAEDLADRDRKLSNFVFRQIMAHEIEFEKYTSLSGDEIDAYRNLMAPHLIEHNRQNPGEMISPSKFPNLGRHASRLGNVGLVKILLNLGIDIDSSALLHNATGASQLDLMSFLIEQGADLEVRSFVTERSTLPQQPIYVAALYNRFYIDRGYFNYRGFYGSIDPSDDVRAVRLLVDEGVRVHEVIGGSFFSLNVLSELLNSPLADLNAYAPFSYGWTYFHNAIIESIDSKKIHFSPQDELDRMRLFLDRGDRLDVNLPISRDTRTTNLPLVYAGSSPLLMALADTRPDVGYDKAELLFTRADLTIDVASFEDAASYREGRFVDLFVDNLKNRTSMDSTTKGEVLKTVVYNVIADILEDNRLDSRYDNLDNLLDEFEANEFDIDCVNNFTIDGGDTKFVHWFKRIRDRVPPVPHAVNISVLLDEHTDCLDGPSGDPDAGEHSSYRGSSPPVARTPHAEKFEIDPEDIPQPEFIDSGAEFQEIEFDMRDIFRDH